MLLEAANLVPRISVFPVPRMLKLQINRSLFDNGTDYSTSSEDWKNDKVKILPWVITS